MKHAACSLAALVAVLLAAPSSAQTQTDILVPSDGRPGDRFGWDLDLQGDVALVGAPRAWASPPPPAKKPPDLPTGAVYVFERGPGGWTEVQKLVAADGKFGDRFGHSVAMDGDLAVVGASGAGNGAAYVFERTASGWVEGQRLVNPNKPNKKTRFGSLVAIDGERIAVSAPKEGWGTVYVFERLLPVWKQAARIEFAPAVDDLDLVGGRLITGKGLSDGWNAILFERTGPDWEFANSFPGSHHSQDGYRVALHGDQAFIGAPQYWGWVTIYERGDGTWPYVERINDPLSAGGNYFGSGLAVQGDRMVVGALFDSYWVTGTYKGAAYILRSEPDGWMFTSKLTPSDGQDGGTFGNRVALSADTILVGAPAWLADPETAGKAYVFEAPDVAQVFCRCELASPCSNDYPLGGCVNSSLEGGALGASGSASVGADDLVLQATRLPVGQFGMVFMGDLAIAPLVLGDGLRCVGGQLFRFPPHPTGSGGTFDEGPGIVAHSATFGAGGAIVAGSTWHFQAWVRDPAGPCGQGSNLTDALSVTFTP